MSARIERRGTERAGTECAGSRVGRTRAGSSARDPASVRARARSSAPIACRAKQLDRVRKIGLPEPQPAVFRPAIRLTRDGDFTSVGRVKLAWARPPGFERKMP